MDVVLGSSSPRRKLILSGIIESFSVVAPDINEDRLPDEKPVQYTRRISEKKCASIQNMAPDFTGDHLIITSDTTVACGDTILGKPADMDSAVSIFRLLSGMTHQVITAVTILTFSEGMFREMFTGHEVTNVSFKKLDNETIYRYLGLIEFSDKAGGYAFQEHGTMIIEGFSGSVTNIIGFPLRLFFRMSAELGIVDKLFTV